MAVKLPDFDQWIDAMAPVLGLSIAPEQRAGVKANLKTAAKMDDVHHVLVLGEGYEYEDRRFSSLTQVASTITGTHWSGPTFFGLKKRRPSKWSDAGPA